MTFALALPWQAFAEAADSAGPRTEALLPAGSELCFKQTYDEAHLKQHPRQLLSEFYLYRLMDPDPDKETVEISRDDAIAQDKRPSMTRWVSVLARFKDDRGYYRQSVECRDSETSNIFCGRDCDGGGFGVTRKDDGLLLYFGDETGGGLALESSCDPDEDGRDRWLDPKDDQEHVRLHRAPLAECMAPDRAAHPAYAEDPMPLRERIRLGGWRCLKRVYDAKHLRAHPRQTVAAIALAIAGEARMSKDSDGYSSTELDVRLSLRLKDGMRSSKSFTCLADEFQFRCDEQFRLRRRDGNSAMLLAGGYGSGNDPAQPLQLLGLNLASDDLRFRLDASTNADCSED